MKERLDHLRTTISHHNYQYYVVGEPEIPDSVFDQMFRTLVDLERQYPEFYDPNSPSARVGSDLRNNFPTIAHISPMLSIDAVQTLQNIEAFTTGFDTIVQLKYDGVGINLIYKGGKLWRAITRGDGFKGVDVTTNIRTFANIPYTINTTKTIEIRGEVWCSWSELHRLQALGEQVKSPIAVAINTIKFRKSTDCAKRRLTFTAFQVISQSGSLSPAEARSLSGAEATQLSTLYWLAENGFNIPYVISLAKALHIVESNYCDVNQFPNCHDVHADGLVFKHNDLALCDDEGYSTRAYNWVISWKFDKELHECTIAGIGGKVAINSRVTPLVFINPVIINSETISKIPVPMLSLPNLSVGQTVLVRRMGTRVAQIVNLNLSTSPEDARNRCCPQCGAPLEHRKQHFYCTASCATTMLPRADEHYSHFTIVEAGSYSTDPAMFQYIVNSQNGRLIPLAPKSKKLKLFYNEPVQLARIGHSLGKYAHQFHNLIEHS